MRVLVLRRPAGHTGGDTAHAHGYAAGLAANGVDVALALANDLRGVDAFDVVHMFAAVSPDWGYPAAQAVKAAGVPLVISPIWWTRQPRLQHYGLGADVYPGYTGHVAAVMQQADFLAVYTMSEALQVWQLVPHHPAYVMGVGFDGVEQEPVDNPAEYVITVGRVEKHKNQLNLALACRELGVILVCVGPVVDAAYAAKVKAAGGHLTGELSHDETMHALANARVFALPSFSENVSVASCEANALGVPAVLSNIGCGPEFFGIGPTYCSPADWRDIATAIGVAWHAPRRQWANVPTWKEVAAGMIPVLKGVAHAR